MKYKHIWTNNYIIVYTQKCFSKTNTIPFQQRPQIACWTGWLLEAVYTRKSKMRSFIELLLLVMKLIDVEYLRITTSRQCCTNTCNLTFWVPPKKTQSQNFPPWPWRFHHPAIFCERRSSNSSGNVCKDHCFNICLRNFPLLLPLLVLAPRRMASLNQRDQIWTCKMSEPKSCEPKLHLSFGKTMKIWRWWMIHTQSQQNSVHKCAKGKPMMVGDRFPDPENWKGKVIGKCRHDTVVLL